MSLRSLVRIALYHIWFILLPSCYVMQIQNISLVPISSGGYEITDVCSGVNSFGNPGKTKVQCDMQTDKGGWIVIQRRVPNGTVNFYRGWKDYEEGFGNLDSEFWYGLRNIHCLTTRESVELRIDLQDEQGNKLTWVYQQFSVDGSDQKYRLHIGQGTGTLSGSFDAMASHNNMTFSTFDRDNDQSNGNCAVSYKGAWWYRGCFNANLNGPHDPITPPPPTATANRIVWYNGSYIYYPSVEMKVRPKTCVLPTTTQCK